MWDTVMPHTSGNWEPIELQMLKHELAHLNCNCNACETYRNTSMHNAGSQNDEAVQVEQKTNLSHILDKYIYAELDVPEYEHTRLNIVDYFRKDVFCPNCFFIWDLLRRVTKVFKDAESEMKPESSDKATERIVIFADNATSVANNKLPIKVSSNLTLCDFISESSSRSSFITRNNDPPFEFELKDKKKNHDRVTFLDDCLSDKDVKKDIPTFQIQGNCFCLDNYMAAIRPPYHT